MVVLLYTLIGCTDRESHNLLEKNYGKEIDTLADDFDLPAPFLKALIVLESSGRKDVPPRFEQKVYNDLIDLRTGKRKRFEQMETEDIRDASNEALRNLASSWGPFQLMGYKCVELGVQLNDMRGKDCLYWSVYWINKNYGHYLRQKKYQEAFRIHNTGSPVGKTHDPQYVKNGLDYLDYFEKNKDFK